MKIRPELLVRIILILRKPLFLAFKENVVYFLGILNIQRVWTPCFFRTFLTYVKKVLKLNSRKSSYKDHPLTTQIKFVFNNFFRPSPTIIQIQIKIFYFRYFIEDMTCCKVFSLNVFIHFIT